MKIAVTMFPLDNLGGIVSCVENAIAGFMELGHTVDYYLLAWQDKFMKGKYSDRQLIRNKKDPWYQGCLYAAHQMKGWNFPLERKIPYKGEKNLRKAKRILSKYDMVLWMIPVPTRQKQNKGNLDWIELYKANSCNVLCSHDPHLINNYPYIYEIKENISGIATVHMAGYNNMKLGDVQSALILNGKDLSQYKRKYNYHKRSKGFLSLQTYKAYKRCEEILRAIPYMHLDKIHMAGGGREQAYMTSPDKCKEEYFCSRKYDPDLPRKYERKKMRIWDLALKHGMIWHHWITPGFRDELLSEVRCLIDASWQLHFAKAGGHFNRVFIDACAMGVVPIGRNFGISDNSEGISPIFQPNKNYIMIPHDATPKEFAERVDAACNLPKKKWRSIIENNYELMKHFDRKFQAQQFINLSKGKKAGFFQDRKTRRTTDPLIITKSAKMMKDFFGQTKPIIHKEGIRNFMRKK